MPNNPKSDSFKVDSFKPVRLKEAREALDRHVLRVQMHAETNEDYKKGALKEESIWKKLTGFFKG